MNLVKQVIQSIPEKDAASDLRALSLAIQGSNKPVIIDLTQSVADQSEAALRAVKLARAIEEEIPYSGKLNCRAFLSAAKSLPEKLFDPEDNKEIVAHALAIVAQSLGDKLTVVPENPALEKYKKKINITLLGSHDKSVIREHAELSINFPANSANELIIEFSGSRRLIESLTGYEQTCKSFEPGDMRLYGLLRSAGLPNIIELTHCFPYEKLLSDSDSRILGLGQQRDLRDFIMDKSLFSFQTTERPLNFKNLINQPLQFLRSLMDKEQRLVTRSFIIRPAVVFDNMADQIRNHSQMKMLAWLLKTSKLSKN